MNSNHLTIYVCALLAPKGPIISDANDRAGKLIAELLLVHSKSFRYSILVYAVTNASR